MRIFPHKTANTTEGRLAVRLIGTAAVALSMIVLPSSTSMAMTPNVKNATDHYFHCLQLMLTDPAAHAKECGPNNIPTNNNTLATPIVGSPPAPPPEEDDCEWERKPS